MSWLESGIWNTTEHFATRALDAAVTFLLIWMLAPEAFSRLVLAQAIVAPLLFVFISLEHVLYRDYGSWREMGFSVLIPKVRSLRIFNWFLAIAIVVFSLAMGSCAGRWFWTSSAFASTGTIENVAAFLWAFTLPLAPNLLGVDRVVLRLELRMRELNWLTLFQKATLLGFAAAAVFITGGRFSALAFAAGLSTLLSGWLNFRSVQKILAQDGAKISDFAVPLRGHFGATISNAFKSFSLWNHSSMVALNWFQNMDVFFLGAAHLPARTLGLYGTAVKLANMMNIFPQALANLFSVWLGRGGETAKPKQELNRLRRFSFLLIGLCIAQAFLLIALAPWVIGLLSRGRWDLYEMSRMVNWTGELLIAAILLGSTLLCFWWLSVRKSASELFLKIHLPWILVCAVTLGVIATRYGTDTVAITKGGLALGYFIILIWFVKTKSR